LQPLVLVLLILVYFFVIRTKFCAVIEMMVGILLCALAVRKLALERSLTTFGDLLGAILVLVATFENAQKVAKSNRKDKPPGSGPH